MGEVERVPEPLDVGPVVLRVLVTGEVVVGGQVDHGADGPALADRLEDLGQLGPLADVDLMPDDVRVDRGPAPGLRPACDALDLVVVLELVQEVAPHEPGGARHDQPGERHRQARTRAASPSMETVKTRSGLGGGPATTRPSSSNVPS